MNTRGLAYGTLAGSLLFVTGVGSMAIAAPPGAPPSQFYDQAATEAIYAADAGVSTDEAADALAQQETFNQYYTDLLDRFGPSSVDAWIEGDGRTQQFHLRTTNQAIIDDATTQDLGLDIVVEDAAPIAGTEDSVLDELEPEAKEAYPGLQGMAIDVVTGEVVLDVVSAPAQRSGTSMAAASQLAADAQAAGGLRINYQTEPSTDRQTIRGGNALSTCTIGFTGKQGSTKGFFTAAHCTGTQKYWANPSGAGAAAGTSTLKVQVHNNTADIAFRSIASGDTINGQFYGASSAVTAGGGVDVAAGTTVCRRGKTSGYGCGKYTGLYKPTWADACPGTTCKAIFRKVNLGTQGGDSGGPWFTGNAPLGIHKGGSSSMSVYSGIAYRPSGTSLG